MTRCGLFVTGSFTFTHQTGLKVAGHYMVILKREECEWRIHRHMATMVLPEDTEEADEGNSGETSSA